MTACSQISLDAGAWTEGPAIAFSQALPVRHTSKRCRAILFSLGSAISHGVQNLQKLPSPQHMVTVDVHLSRAARCPKPQYTSEGNTRGPSIQFARSLNIAWVHTVAGVQASPGPSPLQKGLACEQTGQRGASALTKFPSAKEQCSAEWLNHGYPPACGAGPIRCPGIPKRREKFETIYKHVYSAGSTQGLHSCVGTHIQQGLVAEEGGLP